jgi:hypothetical protein
MIDLDLRPLSLGEILDRTFSLYRRHFILFVGIFALTQLPGFGVNLARVQLIQPPVVHLPGGPPPTLTDAFFSTLNTGTLISVLLGVATYLFTHGGTVFAASESYFGRPTTIGASLRHAWGNLGKLFLVLLLNTAAILGGLILLIAPGVYVALRSIVCIPVAMLEDVGPGESFSRSFRLTEGSMGSSFVIYLLYYVLAITGAALLGYPFTRAAISSVKNPGMMHLWSSLSIVGSFLTGIFVGPIFTIAATVFYYDLRVRKEGFDLQLMMNQVGGTAPGTAEAPTTLA